MPLSLKLFSLLTAVFFTCSGLRGQELIYRQFTTEQGLAGTEVYDVHQDRKGFLWFASDKGLCRYDGHEFVVFTTQNGLSENVIFSIDEDRSGTLWFRTFTKGVCCFRADSFFVPAFNKELIAMLGSNNWIKNLVFDKWGQPWFSLVKTENENIIYYGDTLGRLRKHIYANEGAYRGGMIADIDGALLEQVMAKRDYAGPLAVKQAVGASFLRLEMQDLSNAVRLDNGSIFCSSRKKVFRLKCNSIDKQYELTSHCTRIYYEDRRHLWFATFDGAFLLDPESGEPLVHYLKGRPISDILRDSEGNYWFTTLDAGVYMVSSLEISRYSYGGDDSEKIINFAQSGQGLYFSTFQGKLYRLDKEMNVRLIPYDVKNIHIQDMVTNDKNELLLSNGYIVDEKTLHSEELGGAGTKTMVVLKNGDVLQGTNEGFQVLQGKGRVWNSVDTDFNLRVTAVNQDEEENIWIGTLYGLYCIPAASGTPDYSNIQKRPVSQRVNTILCDGGMLIIGTGEEGIIFFENGKEIAHLSEANGLAGNFVNKIIKQSENTWWVATYKGLSRIVKEGGAYKSEVFTRDDGLPANEINALCLYRGYLWVGTDQGLVYFKPDGLRQKLQEYTVYLTRFRVNRQDTLLASEYSLRNDQRQIDIGYGSVNFRYPEKVRYHYMLEGLHSSWTSTQSRNIQFASLKPGHYKLRLKAGLGEDPAQGGPEMIMDFIIARHFTETGWFIGLVISGIIILLSGGTFFYWRFEKKRVRNRESLVLSEQKALRTQMNPHFVFNAMNSIQYYISENNTREAGIFLSRFSSLIRTTLENSARGFITLEDELDYVRQYLELEQLRFANRFQYEVKVDPSISLSDNYMPSMMIQPFLENAVWHGLMPKSKGGYLQFSLEHKGEYIYCQIEDNGIGRHQARTMNRNRIHKSSALTNINERIGLINTIHKLDMNLRIEDIELPAGATGTRVILSFKTLNHATN